MHGFIQDETGSMSIEYALCVMAGSLIAGVLIAVLISQSVADALTKLIADALSP
ncbi:DUF4244 domain-containing protein [Actinokineospora globicatena]|uniref:DUF4244 domain-containing protein n=1 Tax=Actinokineospora globicatena TaxID=103729 RepID=A0A9W6QUX1_9PSEU|nr:DUF4244 domain-containing protein [Actinokineospora globicatena]MCP2300960.1 Protein of unknown function (DUF4244) [Actinokineospora globicatena]GLW77409.1 hypothetical protein Aglo01_18910 [Actinokineospora globicatena]GLW84243.1 hypothetical protein Aglo02_18830 [Actinokineospora globicatena]GLW95518.1 hypothetical protein Aglo03_63340 [Actinokineospora globicatena]